MSKLIQLPSFQTTDNTIFTGPNAQKEAAEHQAKLDNGAAIEEFIKANGLVKSAAGAARNMLPKFLAFMAGRVTADDGAVAADAVATGGAEGEAQA